MSRRQHTNEVTNFTDSIWRNFMETREDMDVL